MFSLFRHDLRRATRNTIATIVMIGLVVIPALFTWFNVIASWNPFSHTDQLTVAVANTDDGYESDIMPMRVNIGDSVLNALRANNDLNWVVTSKEEAIDGTESGEYYAAIVLPPRFSHDMMTFYANDSNRTEIEYYINEKKNALAPKITAQGASQVSAKINRVFAETLGEVAMNVVTSLSDRLDEPDVQSALTRLESHTGQAAAQLRAGADTAEMFSSLAGSSKRLVTSASDLAEAAGQSVHDATGAIGGGASAVRSLDSTLSSASSSLGSAFSATEKSYQAVGDRVDEVYSSLNTQSGDAAGTVDALTKRVQTQIDQYEALRDRLEQARADAPDAVQEGLDQVITRVDDAIARQQTMHDRLEDASERIASGNSDRQKDHAAIQKSIAAAKKAVQNAQGAYNNSLKPQLDELGDTLQRVRSGIADVESDLSGGSAALSNGSDSVLGVLDHAESDTQKIASSMTASAKKLDKLADALSRAQDTGKLDELTEVIGDDPSALASSIAAPVDLQRQAVFPVKSFGSAMSPLYTMLSLWVGALLISVSIRVDVPNEFELTPTRQYFGRYGIFALLGFLQSSLVSLGNIFFLGVEPAHPFLLVFACWVMSLVFTLMTYTFVVLLGNAGKAISVLLLVMQISTSGGAYPLQVLPEWFQSVSPFLPAVHAVNALRSALAGVYHGDYWVHLGWLALFIVPVLLLGLLLRRPLTGYNRKMNAALEATKIM